MKIAIPTPDFERISGHAGKARRWLVYDCIAGQPVPVPTQITLAKEQVMHVFKDDAPHPLDGVELVIANSAGDGFIRHLKARGAEVLLSGEERADSAIAKLLSGELLDGTRFDITTSLCKVRDLFSHY